MKPARMEHRVHARYRVWLPVQLTGDTLEGMVAVSRDASEGGMFLSASEPLLVGTRIHVTFTVLESGIPHTHEAEAVCLRVEPNADDPHGLWPHRVALRFTAPVPGLSGALEAMQRELAELK